MFRWLWPGSAQAEAILRAARSVAWLYVVMFIVTAGLLLLCIVLIARPRFSTLCLLLPHLAVAPLLFGTAVGVLGIVGDFVGLSEPYRGLGVPWPRGASLAFHFIFAGLISYLFLLPASCIALSRCMRARPRPA